MSSKRHIRKKSCDGKRRHDSRSEAIDHKMQMVKGGGSVGELWVYQCQFCGKWHVGHPPAKLKAKQKFYTENK